MENWIDRAYGLWEIEGEQYYTRLSNDFIGFKIFFREFL